MKWIGKHPPIYVWKNDEWERETDHKLFKTNVIDKTWVTEDEVVAWQKKAQLMKEQNEITTNRPELASTGEATRDKDQTDIKCLSVR